MEAPVTRARAIRFRPGLTTFILLGLLAGVAVGAAMHRLSPAASAEFARLAGSLPTLFLRLIRMIIAPLVFATLVVAVGKFGDIRAIGRVGARTLAWFALAGIVSLAIGLLFVGWLEPGAAVSLDVGGSVAAPGPANTLSLQGFIEHAVPVSVFDALAHNEILQIVVFAVLFGTAAASFGARARVVMEGFDVIAQLMLKVTSYVMYVAPLAVFGATASLVAREGPGVLGLYGVLLGDFYLAVGVLWIALLGLGAAVIGRRVFVLLKAIRAPVLLAFSTASSEAAYPRTLQALEEAGVEGRLASFVLPIGYSFNLDGSMLYCTFAVMFLAQLHGMEIPLQQQLLIAGVLFVTTKGLAGVPRAALVVVAATLPQFGIPEAGFLVLIGIDHFLDMGRSATNVLGNSIAAAVVAKWERRGVASGT